MSGGSSKNKGLLTVAAWVVVAFGVVACGEQQAEEPALQTPPPAPALAPVRAYVLEPYLAAEVGHAWTFENLAPDGLSPILIHSPEEVERDGETWVRREENNGDWRLQRMMDDGLVLRELYFRGGTTVEYAEPALLMPYSLTSEQEHLSETAYAVSKRAADGAPLLVEEGVQTYRVSLGSEEKLEVPAGSFECLEIRTRALRRAHVTQEGDPAEKGYDLTECYANGVGPVRVRGEIYWNDADGARLRTFEVDAVLTQHVAPIARSGNQGELAGGAP